MLSAMDSTKPPKYSPAEITRAKKYLVEKFAEFDAQGGVTEADLMLARQRTEDAIRALLEAEKKSNA